MINTVKGNLLEANAEALVNTVNCVGVMGKGIALQFRQTYPENYKRYKKACDNNEVVPGKMYIFDRGALNFKPGEPRYIINFPTKQHWRGKSKIEYIEDGLDALIDEVKRLDIRSIAIPPLGCGNGGLEWNEVRPRIESAFNQLPDVEVLLFEPGHAPQADEVRIRTAKPRMTLARALYLKVLEMYKAQDYKLGLLEIQKLAYFLQESGIPLKLDYERHQYGPYAENLHHVLQRMEGHYIRGYGDRSDVKAAIYLTPGAIEEANHFLEQHENKVLITNRLIELGKLINGFETPYGMELLATVHWLFRESPKTVDDLQYTIEAVQAWNARKKKLLKPDHIRVAWYHLHETGWVPEFAH